jgi:hypothetical protein
MATPDLPNQPANELSCTGSEDTKLGKRLLNRYVDILGTRSPARETAKRHTRRNMEQWRRDPVAAAEI